jgi:CDGSH-type Zn-finger protein
MAENTPKIIVEHHGPYRVVGGVPLSRKAPVTSEHGEPLTWQKTRTYNLHGNYALCRCGKSSNKPFCDDAHESGGFDGTETAATTDFAERAKNYLGTGIVVKDDRALCTHAGFCGTRVTNVWKMTRLAEDTAVRAQVIAMVERCPSGALTYSVAEAEPDVEPDLSGGIAVTPDGPLWVTGGVMVERSDGKPLESRNRVTLCRCGASKTKPLCDGAHTEIGFKAE